MVEIKIHGSEPVRLPCPAHACRWSERNVFGGVFGGAGKLTSASGVVSSEALLIEGWRKGGRKDDVDSTECRIPRDFSRR